MALKSLGRQLRNGFLSLKGSPWQLWGLYVVKALESFNYFSLSVTFTLYLSEDFGVSDLEAGSIYGLWGTLLTAYGFILGPVIDWVGVRGSLVACFSLHFVARLVVATTTSKRVLYFALLGPLTVAESLGIPVMTIGVKRVTAEENRGFAFALFYTVMNVAAMVNGWLFDIFRSSLRDGLRLSDNNGASGVLNDGYRLFLLTGCGTSLVALVVSCFLTVPRSETERAQQQQQAAIEQQGAAPSATTTAAAILTNGAQADDGAQADVDDDESAPLLADGQGQGGQRPEGSGGGGGDDESAPLLANGGGGGSSAEGVPGLPPRTGGRKPRKPLTLARALDRKGSLLADLDCWELAKYCCVCVVTVNLKSIFRHLEATLPKYLIRSFGCATPVGTIFSINPTLILLLVPIIGAITQRYAPFDMIHLGGYFSALSPLFIVAFNTLWSTIPFVVLLSFGEAIWSPRWYDYSMQVAPDGKEGLFTAAGSAPLFLATLPTGMLSGTLLTSFCPPGDSCDGKHSGITGTCDGRALWGIITAITITSPLLITVFGRWLRPAPSYKDTSLDSLLLEGGADEDDPSRITAPIAEQDQRLEFGEVEAEMHDGGIIDAAHRRRPAARRGLVGRSS